MTDIWQHHRGVAIFTFSFTLPYPAPPSRVLSLVNATRTRQGIALTRLVVRRAMLPRLTEMRVAKYAQMRTAVCTNGAKLT